MSAFSNDFEDDLVQGTFRSHGLIAWPTSTAVSLGDRVYASTGDGNVYVCTTAGTTNSTEPTWNTGLGVTTADNTATWTAYQVGTLKRPIYIALFDTTATLSEIEAGTLTNELSGGSYARVSVPPLDANWSASTDGVTDNVAAITFPTATADWSEAKFFCTIDTASGAGTVGMGGQLSANKTVLNGGVAKFNIGDLDFTFA